MPGDAGGCGFLPLPRGAKPSRAVGFRRLKLALSALTPSLFAGGAIGACLTITSGLPIFPAAFRVVFYGLGLLAWRHFAPAGLVVLGWAFLITGIGIFIYLTDETLMPEFDLPTPANDYPAAIMGMTFGFYHLIYAAWMWPWRRAGSTAPNPSFHGRLLVTAAKGSTLGTTADAWQSDRRLGAG